MQRLRTIGLPAICLCIIFCLNFCSKDAKLSSPNLLMSESIRFQYAVYLLPMHGTGTRKVPALLRDAMAKHPDLTVVEAIPEHPQAMLVRAYIRSDVKQAYAPPDMKALQYFGRDVSGEQAKALQDSSNAVILEFAHPKKYAWSGLRAADEFVEDIARKSGGLVWDEETREVFSPDAWHQKRLANGIPRFPTYRARP